MTYSLQGVTNVAIYEFYKIFYEIFTIILNTLKLSEKIINQNWSK